MKSLSDIDAALAAQDIKRAQVLINKRLRANMSNSERAELYLRRAQARLLDARPDDALEDIETGFALAEGIEQRSESYILRGDIYFARYELAPLGFADRSDIEQALGFYRHIEQHSKDDPKISWVYYQMGRILLSENDITSAQQYLRKALEAPASPANIHALAYERLGFLALFEERNAEVALAHFRKAQELYPPDDDLGWLVQLHIRISRAQLELHNYTASLESASMALRQIQSGNSMDYRATLPEAHMAMGDVLSRMQGYESEAIEHYLKFLQMSKRPPGIDVTWSQIHETIGNLSFRLERYQQALNAYEKALELNPYHPWETKLRYQMGRCYYRMRAYERAIDAIQPIETAAADEKTDISDWRIYNLKGNSYFALERFAEAAQAYRKAIEIAPDSTQALERTHIYLRFSEELLQSHKT